MARSRNIAVPFCLAEAQAVLVEAAVADFAGCWSVVRHEGCDGELMLVVMPEDDDLATFTVSAGTVDGATVDGSVGGFDLAALRDDVLHPCGRFDAIRDLIAALRGLAETESAGQGFRRV